MTTLAEYVDNLLKTFPVNRPIFVARLDGGQDRELSFQVKDPVGVASEDFTDPVDQLVAYHAAQRSDKPYHGFNNNTVKYEWECDVNTIYRYMTAVLLKVYLNHSSLKNPKASGGYKWLCKAIDDRQPEFAQGVVALYRYIAQNHNVYIGGSRFKGVLLEPHAKNVMAILGKMREKYER